MLTFDALVQDIIQRRGKLGTKEGADSVQDYHEVWAAFANYVRACMDQRRGLQLSSFCKIGWTMLKKLGKTSYRPYFHFSDAFVRAYLSQEAARKHTGQVPQGDLCAFEDFNFSKAALKFSNQLTKDQARFAGFYKEDLVGSQQIPDSLVFSQEGVPPPTAEPTVPGAPAFRKEAPQAASLQVRGAQPGKECCICHVEPELQCFEGGAPRAMGEGEMEKSAVPGLTALQFKKEIAFKEAMDRHIAAMEAHAHEAVAEKDAWDSHVSATRRCDECLLQEREEIQARKERNHMNLHFLKHQMALGEHKRKEQRRDDIEAASAHDFPAFSEVHPDEMKDFVKGQQAKVREALDDQVRTNNTLRNLAKQKDLALELNQLQANREELAMLRNAERAKKAYDKEALATAWNADIRMKNIWKAIDTWRVLFCVSYYYYYFSATKAILEDSQVFGSFLNKNSLEWPVSFCYVRHRA
ncbi:unnamed protein product [Effrenium voratum]|nr:unnamed protein product [Effrenium voratum]